MAGNYESTKNQKAQQPQAEVFDQRIRKATLLKQGIMKEYKCPHCGHKMIALEADAAYDGCPSCRKRIEWDSYLTGPEIGELEYLAESERWQRETDRRAARDRRRKEEFLSHNDTDNSDMCFSDADPGL